jgi:FAD synthase
MNYEIMGEVIKGDGYGRKIGFPTINLAVENEVIPEAGVYAGTATLEGKEYRAGIVINVVGKTEAHLIGYEGDAYGKTVTLKVEKFLREYKHFTNEADLILQIKKDLTQC